MEFLPAGLVTLLWLLFFGTHVGLGMSGLRQRLGAERYVIMFVVVASGTFIALCAGYAVVQYQGAAGLAWQGRALPGIVALSFAVIASAIGIYPRSPMARADGSAPEPKGFARITRHGFMVGAILFASAHALMATRLTGTVFFGGFVVLALLGSLHQDRRLLRDRGTPYVQYLRTTSFLPFAAIIGGRQRLVLRELSWISPSVGLALAFALRWLHPYLFEAYGLPFAALLLVPAWYFTWRAIAQQRQLARQA